MRWLVLALLALLLCVGCDVVVGVGDDDEYCRLSEVEDGGMCRRLAPQCGCDEGQTCGLEGACQPAGTLPSGAVCTPGMNECAAGTDCVRFYDSVEQGHCREFCSIPSRCEAPGSLCVNASPVPVRDSLGVCTVSCTPGEVSTCAPGTFCVGLLDTTGCQPEGPSALGESCDEDVGCEAPLICLVEAEGPVCRAPCGPAFADCPAPLECVLGVLGDREPVTGDDYGFCTTR